MAFVLGGGWVCGIKTLTVIDGGKEGRGSVADAGSYAMQSSLFEVPRRRGAFSVWMRRVGWWMTALLLNSTRKGHSHDLWHSHQVLF